MDEDARIDSAEYFLNWIERSKTMPNATQFFASAFFSAARSALQLALKEAAAKPGGHKWYESAVFGHTALEHLRNHRGINVHQRPLPLRTHATRRDSSGTYSTTSGTLADSDPSVQLLPAEGIAFEYDVTNWSGSENLEGFCILCLIEIKRLVADGRQKGFLTS